MSEKEALYRWTKNVPPDKLGWWETELAVADVVYTAEHAVGRKTWQLSSYSSTREEMEALKGRFGGGVSEVFPDSWQHAAGDAQHSPIKIRDRFVITAASDEKAIQSMREEFPGRDVLSIPPRLAFGTGEHPTTANCLRFLVDAVRKADLPAGWRCLDVGCGSGIIAIAASFLDAGESDAIELDADAIGVAAENGERHGRADINWIEADALRWLEDRESHERYPLVVANLFSSLLVELFPKLVPHLERGASVIISGFLTSQTREVVASAKASGIDLTDFARRGKWVAASGVYRPK